MSDRYNRLAKNSAAFMIANFGSKILSFILVPFYTHVLTTEEYGTVDALIATVSLLSPIASFGIGDVIVMFLSKREVSKEKIFTNATAIIVVGNVIVSIIYPLIYLSNIFSDFIIYFVCLVLVSSIYGVLQMYARGTDKVAQCALSGVIYTAVLALSNIVLLLWLHLGIAGYLCSTIFAYSVPSLYLLYVIEGKKLKLSLLDRKLLRNILQLSIPIIPTAVLWSIMNLADKYTILFFMGPSANGIYTVAYKIPTIISVIYGIFQPAWQLTTFELVTKKDRSETYSKLFELLTGAMFGIGAILLIVNRLYVTYLCNENYSSAWKVSPIIMYSAIFNCLSGFIGSNYLIMHNTKAVLKISVVGSILNVLVNLILVPLIGLYGAAVATCIGYIYMFGKKYLETSSFTALNVNRQRFCLSNIIIIILCVSVLSQSNILFYIINVFGVLCLLFLYRDQYSKLLYYIIKTAKRKLEK